MAPVRRQPLLPTAAFAAGARPGRVAPPPPVRRGTGDAGIDEAVLYSESPTPPQPAQGAPDRPSVRTDRLRAVTRSMRGEGGEDRG